MIEALEPPEAFPIDFALRTSFLFCEVYVVRRRRVLRSDFEGGRDDVMGMISGKDEEECSSSSNDTVSAQRSSLSRMIKMLYSAVVLEDLLADAKTVDSKTAMFTSCSPLATNQNSGSEQDLSFRFRRSSSSFHSAGSKLFLTLCCTA